MTDAAICPECGTGVAPDARFCPSCGLALAGAPTAEAVRKVVTVLFADVSGSTTLGERLDPEILRGLMNRYFIRMRAIIEGHGGTVEKFIGDAVMAVFGIPRVHEDDALRAVRAAADIRDALEAMNAHLEAQRGMAIRFRTGVNTGEVVAGDPGTATTLVTGDTVNTAARLEQAAPLGEILLGNLTYSLVRDAVEAEPVAPIAAKGKTQPVPAWRLVRVHAGAPGRARNLDALLVGRDDELATLTAAWRRAADGWTPQLVALVGGAGVGKSRLVREVVGLIRESGRVLVGRCLSYGEGITYWPLREIAHGAAGIGEADDRQAATAKLADLLAGAADGAAIASRVASAIGLSSERVPQEEIFWAARRLLEHLAGSSPMLVVVEDVHWAEDTLLDLVDHVVDRAAPVPLLVLATARPDVLDRRPSFATQGAAMLERLEPLGGEAAGALLDLLPGGAAIPPGVRDRILAAAEGNPLYVEEFVGLLRDDGRLQLGADGSWRATAAMNDIAVPPTVHALLSARLEGLPDTERRVAQRASVIGRTFEVDALNHLEREQAAGELAARLIELVRKELLRPDRAELTVGDAFRFRHVLIRDAAYEALAKSERAELHERVADWIERVAGDRLGELEEIVGYHLEQATHYRTELGETGSRVDELAQRAGARLANAGRRAYARNDPRAAIRLLQGATRLLGDGPEGDAARPDLAEALMDTGELDAAVELLAAVEPRATARGDRELAAQVAVLRLELRRNMAPALVTRPVHDEDLLRTREIVEACGSDLAASRFWRAYSTSLWDRDDFAGAEHATSTALDHARRAGADHEIASCLLMQAIEAMSGPTPVPLALKRFDELLAFRGTGMLTGAESLHRKAVLEAMDARMDDARRDVAAGLRRVEELGASSFMPEARRGAAWIERLAGAYDAEAAILELAVGEARSVGQGSAAAWLAAIRALALLKLGRIDDARAAYAAAEADAYTRTVRIRNMVRARLLAVEGRHDGALAAAQVVEDDVLGGLRSFPNAVADHLVEMGVVAHLSGDVETARRRATIALQTARAKANRALEAKAERLLAGNIRDL